MDPEAARARVVSLAEAEGFPLVRIAAASVIEGARVAALAARAEGRLADLGWMTDEWLERSTDPGRFLQGARSVVVVALPYAGATLSAPEAGGPARGKVARYAAGRDYHRVFETKLRRLAATIRREFDAGARATVDYGPLLERPLAALAGLGWLGKSTMLLAPGFGPWVLLGAVATTLDLRPDEPLKKSCGSCTRCVVACPTGAIAPDGQVLDARLCISYHTIENRGPIPRELRAKFGAWVFGCDDCLESCPVGARSTVTYPDFDPADQEAAAPDLAGLLLLDEVAFAERFRGRAIMRAKRDGLLRNACIALGNVGAASDVDALCGALADSAALVRGHAAWGLGRLAGRLGGGCVVAARVALEIRLMMEHDPWAREEIEAALSDLSPPPEG